MKQTVCGSTTVFFFRERSIVVITLRFFWKRNKCGRVYYFINEVRYHYKIVTNSWSTFFYLDTIISWIYIGYLGLCKKFRNLIDILGRKVYFDHYVINSNTIVIITGTKSQIKVEKTQKHSSSILQLRLWRFIIVIMGGSRSSRRN